MIEKEDDNNKDYEHPYKPGINIGKGRKCTQCGDWKTWDKFNKNKFNVTFGMRSYCKNCSQEMYRRNVAIRTAEMSA